MLLRRHRIYIHVLAKDVDELVVNGTLGLMWFVDRVFRHLGPVVAIFRFRSEFRVHDVVDETNTLHLRTNEATVCHVTGLAHNVEVQLLRLIII